MPARISNHTSASKSRSNSGGGTTDDCGEDIPMKRAVRIGGEPASKNKLLLSFFHACQTGNKREVEQMLAKHPEIDVTEVPEGGTMSPLKVAIANEHSEVLRKLLEICPVTVIYEALLNAIEKDQEDLANLIVVNKRFPLVYETMKFGGDEFQVKGKVYVRMRIGGKRGVTKEDTTSVGAELGAIVLAAQKNMFQVVQKLLEFGERIEEPHMPGCTCSVCSIMSKTDDVRLAILRLEIYKGLSSSAYISLTSYDPMLQAMNLRKRLQKISHLEAHFKSEYEELASGLEEYMHKLMDCVRDKRELEMLLNKTTEVNKFEDLARLKLGVINDEKKLISHPLCQQKLREKFYDGTGFIKIGWLLRIPILLGIIISYPILAVIFLILPNSPAGRLISRPFIKFLASFFMNLSFLTLVFLTTTFFAGPSSNYKLCDYNNGTGCEAIQLLYQLDVNDSISCPLESELNYRITGDRLNFLLQIEQIQLRKHVYYEDLLWLIQFVMVVGFLMRECKQLYGDTLKDHFSSYYNWMDALAISLYLASFSLSFVCYARSQDAVNFFTEHADALSCNGTAPSLVQKWIDLLNGDEDSDAANKAYWLLSDRWHWAYYDPTHIKDGLYSLANVLSFMRVSQLMVMSEVLGPMQISLGKMIKNIIVFSAILVLIVFAFVVGAMNLFWYYNDEKRREIEFPMLHKEEIKGGQSFGTLKDTVLTLTWAMFTMEDNDVYSLKNFGSPYCGDKEGCEQGQGSVVQDFGFVIFLLYNIALVIVMLNMLIAMMAQSFDETQGEADMEWKFARTELIMEFIGEGSVLPPPLNIIPNPLELLMSVIKKQLSAYSIVKPDEAQAVIFRNRYGLQLGRCDSFPVDRKSMKRFRQEYGKFSSVKIRAEAEEEFQKVLQEIIGRFEERERMSEGSHEIFELKNDILAFRTELNYNINSLQEVLNSQTNVMQEIRSNSVAAKKGQSSPIPEVRFHATPNNEQSEELQ